MPYYGKAEGLALLLPDKKIFSNFPSNFGNIKAQFPEGN